MFSLLLKDLISDFYSSLNSSQSLNLGGRRGTTDDVAAISFHPSLSSAALMESPNSIPVHSLMLSSHLFFCLLLLLASSGSSNVAIWVSVSLPWVGDHHVLQMHSGFCCETRLSSHGLCRKCSEVSSRAWILLSISAIKVQLSQA